MDIKVHMDLSYLVDRQDLKEVPDLILTCTFSVHEFGISPTVGTLLSQMAMQEDTILDVSAFRYDRFKAKI